MNKKILSTVAFCFIVAIFTSTITVNAQSDASVSNVSGSDPKPTSTQILTVKVIDLDTTQLISEATVHASRSTNVWVLMFFSRTLPEISRGMYSGLVLMNGEYTILVTKPGYTYGMGSGDYTSIITVGLKRL